MPIYAATSCLNVWVFTKSKKIKHSNYPIEKDNIGVITWQNDKVFYFIDCLVAYFLLLLGRFLF
jgi:hypothetical protein